MQQNEISLTIEEVSEMYGYSVASIRRNFKRTAQSIQKRYGMDLFKYTGPDGETFYKISSPRAITMYEEIKDQLYVPIESIKMDDLACFVLIGVAATPQGVFRGTRANFLDYMGLSHNKRNIELLNQVLSNFSKMQDSPLCCQQDESYIIVYVKRDFEKRQILTINMLRQCQEIAQKHNKKSMKIVQLLKVWQAYRINQQKGVNPLTNRDLQVYVDLSEKQIRDARKMLQGEGVLNTSRVGYPTRRIGTSFALNAFMDDKDVVIND